MNNLFCQKDDYEDEAYDGGMAYGRGHRQMANLNPNMGGGFSFPNYDRRRDYLSPNEYRMKIKIPSFSKNCDIEFFLDWVYEVEKFFDMTYSLRRSMSSSWHTSSKEEQSHGKINYKSQGDIRASHP